MGEAQWFGGRLRELREQAGLTQQQLAARAGLSQRAVSHWEQGLREPSWSNVIALAKALAVSCEAFLQEPSLAPPAGPGRPRKAPAESADRQGPKRPRGRPRKAPATQQNTRPIEGQSGGLSGQKKPATGQRRNRKGKGDIGSRTGSPP